MAMLEDAKESLAEGALADLAEPVVDLVCEIDAGDWEPDLVMAEVVESTVVRLAIRGFCTARDR